MLDLNSAQYTNHNQLLSSHSTQFDAQRSFRPSHLQKEQRARRLCPCQRKSIMCSAEGSAESTKKRIVILGGTGRVGSSTAVALLRKDPDMTIVVSSRQRSSYDEAVKKRPKLAGAQFEQVEAQLSLYCKAMMMSTMRHGSQQIRVTCHIELA